MYNFSYPRKKLNCCVNINLTLFLQPLDFLNSDPSFSLEGRIIRKVEKKKEKEKEKVISIEYLPCPWFCSRLSKVKVDVSVSILSMKNLEFIKQCIGPAPSKKQKKQQSRIQLQQADTKAYTSMLLPTSPGHSIRKVPVWLHDTVSLENDIQSSPRYGYDISCLLSS